MGQGQSNHVTGDQAFSSEFSHSWTWFHTKQPGDMVLRGMETSRVNGMLLSDTWRRIEAETDMPRQEQKTDAMA